MDAGSSSSTARMLIGVDDADHPRQRLSVLSEETETTPRARLPPPRYGELITVLSIDGGGIRGLIPAVVLQKLEEKLKLVEKEGNPHVNTENIHIADYFDVIAGTSTGGLIAAMLVTPDDQGRPKYTPQEIQEFYKENGPKIFPPKSWWWWGPAYDGTFLHKKIREVTGHHTLADTVTNLVVPTFDIRRMEPIIFSSFKDQLLQTMGEIKPFVSDVCIGTSAAPTFFPAHHFDTWSTHGAKLMQFHLIDGGVAANNPTMAAISRVTREQLLKNPAFHTNGVDYKKYLVISIGTGSAAAKAKGEYTAESCAKWSPLGWIKPIIDIFSQSSDVLVDWQVRMLLENTDNNVREKDKDQEKRYLRIQAQDPLFGVDMLSMDDASLENLDKLVHIGEELLQQRVARVNLLSGRYAMDRRENVRTNNEELERFARLLVDERRLRLYNQQHQPEVEDYSIYETAQAAAEDWQDWQDYCLYLY